MENRSAGVTRSTPTALGRRASAARSPTAGLRHRGSRRRVPETVPTLPAVDVRGDRDDDLRGQPLGLRLGEEGGDLVDVEERAGQDVGPAEVGRWELNERLADRDEIEELFDGAWGEAERGRGALLWYAHRGGLLCE